MRLLEAIDILAGGSGSGCVPSVARQHGNICGRPPRLKKDALSSLMSTTGKVNENKARKQILEYVKTGKGPLSKVISPEEGRKLKEVHDLVNYDWMAESSFTRKKALDHLHGVKVAPKKIQYLLERLVKAPESDIKLFRGMGIADLSPFDKNTVDLGLSSFSEKRNVAERFAEGAIDADFEERYTAAAVSLNRKAAKLLREGMDPEKVLKYLENSKEYKRFKSGLGTEVILETAGPIKGLNIAAFTDHSSYEKEWITQGRFKILDKKLKIPKANVRILKPSDALREVLVDYYFDYAHEFFTRSWRGLKNVVYFSPSATDIVSGTAKIKLKQIGLFSVKRAFK